MAPLTVALGAHSIFDMWQIFEHRQVEKDLKSLPIDLLKRYEKWKDIVSISGPLGLRKSRASGTRHCAASGRVTGPPASACSTG
jgi:hypothetical protein